MRAHEFITEHRLVFKKNAKTGGISMKWRCESGPRTGRTVSDVKQCSAAPDIKKAAKMKQTRQKTKVAQARKTKKTKRVNPMSRTATRLNKQMRKGLREDNSNNVVFQSNEYRIVLDNSTAPTRATLLHRELVNDREYWAKRGYLQVDYAEKKFDGEIKKYAKVYVIDIEKSHQGKGLGEKLYLAILKNLPNNVAGIGSNTFSRTNKKQVPAIYKKLGAKSYNDGDFQLIPA